MSTRREAVGQRSWGASPLVPLICLFAAFSAIALWAQTTNDATLREQLTRWQFWSLETAFVLCAGLMWLNLPAFLRSLTLSRQALIGVGLASLLAFVLVGWVAPQTSRIYYDEQIYQGIGQNLSDLRLAQMCNDGTVEYGHLQCWRGEYNKQPNGYPYLLSAAYRLVGVGDSVAHWVNVLSSALLVWVVFLITTAMFRDVRAGSLAGLVAALIPQQLLWSHTAAAEPSAALACATAVLAAVCFTRLRTTASLVWMMAMCAFAVQFRPESVLVLAVVLAIVALDAPNELVQARFLWAALLGVSLCALYAMHLYAVRSEDWGSSSARMSLEFVWQNLRTNTLFYLGDHRFPVVYSALAMMAIVARPIRTTIIPLTYFGLFWGVFLFFYAGSYDYGADVRFSLMSYPPLAILAGVGASSLMRTMKRLVFDSRRISIIVGGGLCIQFLWYMPQVRAVSEEAWAARADVAFAQRVIPTLPPNSVVLTHNPSMFLIQGVNAAQMSLAATEPDYVTTVLATRYAGGVFLHWNYWCNVDDPVQQAFCSSALDQFRYEVFREYRERDYSYLFYRLNVAAPRN